MKRFKVLGIVFTLALLLVLLTPVAFMFAPAGMQAGLVRIFLPQESDLSIDFESLRLRPGIVEVGGLKASAEQQRLEWEILRIETSLFSSARALIGGRPLLLRRLQLRQANLYIDPEAMTDKPQDASEPFSFDFLIPNVEFDIRIEEFRADGNVYIKDSPEIAWQTGFIDFNTSGAGTGWINMKYADSDQKLQIQSPIAYQFSNQQLAKVVGSPDLTFQEPDGTRVEIIGIQFAYANEPQQITVSFSQRKPQTTVSIAMASLEHLPEDFPQTFFIEGIIATALKGQTATTGTFEISVTSDREHRFQLKSNQNLVVHFEDDASFRWEWPDGDWLSVAWESFVVPIPDWPTRIQGAVQVSSQNEQLRIHSPQPLRITPLFSQAGLAFGDMQLYLDFFADQKFSPLRLESQLRAKIKNPYMDEPFDGSLSIQLAPQQNDKLGFLVELNEHLRRYPLIAIDGDFDGRMENLTAALVIDIQDLARFNIPTDDDFPILGLFHSSKIEASLVPQLSMSIKSHTDLFTDLPKEYQPMSVESEFNVIHSENHYQIPKATLQVLLNKISIMQAGGDAIVDLQKMANSQAQGNLQIENSAFDLIKTTLPGLSENYQNLNLNFDWENTSGNLQLRLNPNNQPNPAPSVNFISNFNYNTNEITPGMELVRATGNLRVRDRDTALSLRYLTGTRSDVLSIDIGTLTLDPLLEFQERLFDTEVDREPAPPESTSLTAIDPPQTPFWIDYIRPEVRSLKIQLTLASVRLNDQHVIRNLNGELNLLSDRMVLDPFQFELVDAASRINGALHFQPENKQRYRLEIALNSSELDSRKLARLGGTGSDHYLDTLISLNATVKSLGNSTDELFANASSQYSLRTGPGVIRLIDPEQEDPTRDLAVAAGRILLDMIAPRYNVIPALYERMKSTPFDRFEIDADSENPGFISITKFEMRSPELRLSGSGRVLIDFSKPIQQSPLSLRLSLGAKDRMGELLESAGVLRGTPDRDGYRQAMREFNIDGTLGRPNTSDLWRMIINRR